MRCVDLNRCSSFCFGTANRQTTTASAAPGLYGYKEDIYPLTTSKWNTTELNRKWEMLWMILWQACWTRLQLIVSHLLSLEAESEERCLRNKKLNWLNIKSVIYVVYCFCHLRLPCVAHHKHNKHTFCSD